MKTTNQITSDDRGLVWDAVRNATDDYTNVRLDKKGNIVGAVVASNKTVEKYTEVLLRDPRVRLALQGMAEAQKAIDVALTNLEETVAAAVAEERILERKRSTAA